jgi:hypothetical protein
VRRALSVAILIVMGLGVAGCAGSQRARVKDGEVRRGASGQAPDPATTPEPVIQVYAARVLRWRAVDAVHTWIALKPRNATRYTRYEVIGWGIHQGRPAVRVNGAGPDNYWHGNRPRRLLDLRGDGVDAIIARVEAAVAAYAYPRTYRLWPGPNSNTFTACIGRAVPELKLELPSSAIGRDYECRPTPTDESTPAPTSSGSTSVGSPWIARTELGG